MWRFLLGMLLSSAAATTFLLGSANAAQVLSQPVLIGTNTVSTPSQPAVTVDAAGTAYIAWNDAAAPPAAPAQTVLDFCKVPPGATRCSAVQLASPDPTSGQLQAPPSVLVNGTDVYVFEFMTGAMDAGGNDNGMLEWVSSDGGSTFTRITDAVSWTGFASNGGTDAVSVFRLPNGDIGIGYVSPVSNPLFQANSLTSPVNYSQASTPQPPYAVLNPAPSNYTVGDLEGSFTAELTARTGALGVFELIETGPCPNSAGLVFTYAPVESSTTDSALETNSGQIGSPWSPLGLVQCSAGNPALSSGRSGLGLLYTNERANITQYRRFTAPSKFGSSVTVTTGDSLEPTVSEDARGALYATWLSNGIGLRLAYSPNGGKSWLGPRTLLDERDGSVSVAGAASAVDSAGHGWAVYASQGAEYAQAFRRSDAVVAPRDSNLRLHPAVFAPTASRAQVTYSDTESAQSRFAVVELIKGYRLTRGGCRATPRPAVPRGRARGCTLAKTVWGFGRADAVGANHFRFTARLNRHRLRPGTYELRATPRLGKLRGRSVASRFTII